MHVVVLNMCSINWQRPHFCHKTGKDSYQASKRPTYEKYLQYNNDWKLVSEEGGYSIIGASNDLMVHTISAEFSNHI